MQWLIVSDWEGPLFGYLSDIMHPLQLWKLSRGKVRSRVRSCPPRNPSWPSHLLEAPSVSQESTGMCRLWAEQNLPAEQPCLCPDVVWRPAVRRGGETCNVSGRPQPEQPRPPGSHSCPISGVPGVGSLWEEATPRRTVSQAGTSLLPSGCPTSPGRSESGDSFSARVRP